MARVATAAMRKLESAGAVLVRADVPKEMRVGSELTRRVNLCETATNMSAFLTRQGASISFEDLVSQARRPRCGVIDGLRRPLEPINRRPLSFKSSSRLRLAQSLASRVCEARRTGDLVSRVRSLLSSHFLVAIRATERARIMRSIGSALAKAGGRHLVHLWSESPSAQTSYRFDPDLDMVCHESELLFCCVIASLRPY
jgi:hypothetical protein